MSFLAIIPHLLLFIIKLETPNWNKLHNLRCKPFPTINIIDLSVWRSVSYYTNVSVFQCFTHVTISVILSVLHGKSDMIEKMICSRQSVCQLLSIFNLIFLNLIVLVYHDLSWYFCRSNHRWFLYIFRSCSLVSILNFYSLFSYILSVFREHGDNFICLENINKIYCNNKHVHILVNILKKIYIYCWHLLC